MERSERHPYLSNMFYPNGDLNASGAQAKFLQTSEFSAADAEHSPPHFLDNQRQAAHARSVDPSAEALGRPSDLSTLGESFAEKVMSINYRSTMSRHQPSLESIEKAPVDKSPQHAASMGPPRAKDKKKQRVIVYGKES